MEMVAWTVGITAICVGAALGIRWLCRFVLACAFTVLFVNMWRESQ